MQPPHPRESLAQEDSDADGKDDQRRYGEGQRVKCRRVAGHPLSFKVDPPNAEKGSEAWA